MGGWRFEFAVRIKGIFHKLKFASAGSRFEVECRSAFGEEPGGLRLAIRQARKHEKLVVTG